MVKCLCMTPVQALPKRTRQPVPEATAHQLPVEVGVIMEGPFRTVQLAGREPLEDEMTVAHHYHIQGAELLATYELPYAQDKPNLTDDQKTARQRDHTLYIWQIKGGRHAAAEYVVTSYEAVRKIGQTTHDLLAKPDKEVIRLQEGLPLEVGRGDRWLPRAARTELAHEYRRTMSDEQVAIVRSQGELRVTAKGYNGGDLHAMGAQNEFSLDAQRVRMHKEAKRLDNLRQRAGEYATMPEVTTGIPRPTEEMTIPRSGHTALAGLVRRYVTVRRAKHRH